MEFNYSDYLVRLTFNPTDIIVRFEHNKTYRSYEQTFFERDFPQTSMMGGLDFLGKVLSTVFSHSKPNELSIDSFKVSASNLEFTVVLNNPLFLKPIEMTFDLLALRKDAGNLDLNILNRKVKEISEGIEPRLQKLTSLLESRLAVVDSLTAQVKELSERCGSSITLPGCIFAIPINLTSIILVRNQTFLPDGRAFTSIIPQSSINGHPNTGGINWASPMQGVQNGWTSVSRAVDSFTFEQLVCISNLKYLKHCKQVTLSGCSELTDYSALGQMPWLTHLTIINSRNWNNAASPLASAGNNPTLRDISWVKNLKNLQTLVLLGCTSLSDITPLKDLPNLRELDIRETMVRNTDFLINPNLKITK